MIKASKLKENDVVPIDGIQYKTITNHIGDVIFIANEEMHELKGLHLFYDDPADVEWAATKGIDLT